MTAKPITTRACNEQPCVFTPKGYIYVGFTRMVTNLSMWLAYATSTAYNSYVLMNSTPFTTEAMKSYLTINLEHAGITSDVPVAYRDKVFLIYKANTSYVSSSNSNYPTISGLLSCSTSIDGTATYTPRKVSVFGGFTGVCTSGSLATVDVASFAHTSTVYEYISAATSDNRTNLTTNFVSVSSTQPKPATGWGWSGYYFSEGSSTATYSYEGIPLNLNGNTIRAVQAFGVDIYGVNP